MARKSPRKLVIVKNTDGSSYALREVLFDGLVHFTVRQEFAVMFTALYESLLGDTTVYASINTYLRDGRMRWTRTASFNPTTGQLTIGCNDFTKTTARRIARWAGISTSKCDKLWPKKEKLNA